MPNEIEILKALLERQSGFACNPNVYSLLREFLQSDEPKNNLSDALSYTGTPEAMFSTINELLSASFNANTLRSFTYGPPSRQEIQDAAISMAKAYLYNANQRLMESEKIILAEVVDLETNLTIKKHLWKEAQANIEDNIRLRKTISKPVKETIYYLQELNAYSTDEKTIKQNFDRYQLFVETKALPDSTSSILSMPCSVSLFVPQDLYDLCYRKDSGGLNDALDAQRSLFFSELPQDLKKLNNKTDTLVARLMMQFLEDPKKIIQIFSFLNDDEKPLPALKIFRESLGEKMEALLLPYFLTKHKQSSVRLITMLGELSKNLELKNKLLFNLGQKLLLNEMMDNDIIQDIAKCFKNYSGDSDPSYSMDAIMSTSSDTPFRNSNSVTPRSSQSYSSDHVEEILYEDYLGTNSAITLQKIAAVLVEIPDNQALWDKYLDKEKKLYQLSQSRVQLVLFLLEKWAEKKETVSAIPWQKVGDFIANQLWLVLGEGEPEKYKASKNNIALDKLFLTFIEKINVVWMHYKAATNKHHDAKNIQELVKYGWDMLPDTDDGLKKAVELFYQYPQAIREEDLKYWIEHGMQSPAFKIHVWQKLKNPTVLWNNDSQEGIQASMIDTLCENVTVPDYLWALMNTYAKTLSNQKDKTRLIDALIDKVCHVERVDSIEKPREIFKIMKVMLACGNASFEQLDAIFIASKDIVFSEENQSLTDLLKTLLVNYWQAWIKSEEVKREALDAQALLISSSNAIVSSEKSGAKENFAEKIRQTSSNIWNRMSFSGSFTPLSQSSQQSKALLVASPKVNLNDFNSLREDDDEKTKVTHVSFSSSSSDSDHHSNRSLSKDKETMIKEMMALLNVYPAGFDKGLKAWHEESPRDEANADIFLTVFESADTEDKKRVVLNTRRVKPKTLTDTPICLNPEKFMEANGEENFYDNGVFSREKAEKRERIWVHRENPKTCSLQVKGIDSVLLMQKEVCKENWQKIFKDYILSAPLMTPKDKQTPLSTPILTATESIKQQRNTIFSILTKGGDKTQWAFDVLMEKECIDNLKNIFENYSNDQSEVVDIINNLLRAIFVANPVKCLSLLSDPERKEQWKFLDERIHLKAYLYPKIDKLSDETPDEKKWRWAARGTFEQMSDETKNTCFSGNERLILSPLDSSGNSNIEGMRILGINKQNDDTQVDLRENIAEDAIPHLRAIVRDKLFESQKHTNYERMQYYYPDISGLSVENTILGQIYRNICLPIYWLCNASFFRVQSVYGVPVYQSDTVNKKINLQNQNTPSANDGFTYVEPRNESHDSVTKNDDVKVQSGCMPSFGKLFCGMFYCASSNWNAKVHNVNETTNLHTP